MFSFVVWSAPCLPVEQAHKDEAKTKIAIAATCAFKDLELDTLIGCILPGPDRSLHKSATGDYAGFRLALLGSFAISFAFYLSGVR